MSERITIKAERPAYGGLTIGRRDGKVVLIRGAIPGETVEAVVEQEKKDYCQATAVRILEPSPDRIEPECGNNCGGCQIQYISYGRQVRLKEEVLRETLRRTARLEAELAAPLVGRPWRYRRRGQFKVSGGKVGLYREKSHEVMDMDSCPLMADEVNAALAKSKGIIAGTEAREVHISCGDDGAAAFVKTPGGRTDWGKAAAGLLERGFVSVWVEVNNRKLLKYGREYIKLDLDGLKYTVSPASFFQSNWELNRQLVRLIVDGLQPLEGKRALDIYSGAGNFSLPVSMHAGELVAVEENPFAVTDGKRNIGLNGINNCAFVRSDMDAFKPRGRFDIVIADPPRTGLSEAVKEKILTLGPERILYVSCDPATFARDLRVLSGRYTIGLVRLVDFFPQTYHIEAAAFLSTV